MRQDKLQFIETGWHTAWVEFFPPPPEAFPMQLPPPDADTLFEELLQDLPPQTAQMAREFKAFARARKIKTPTQLLRIVLLYCGLDNPLRDVAGHMTALDEPLTDQSIAERLRACGPWLKAVLQQMLPRPGVAAFPQGWRFLVIDASSIQAPGAKGTDYRLHICMDLVSLQFLEVALTAVHTGETRKPFSLGPGDVAIADRGYAHPARMCYAVAQGAELLVRLNPFRVVLCDPTGSPLQLCAALKRQKVETSRTLPVVSRSSSGDDEVRGGGRPIACGRSKPLAHDRNAGSAIKKAPPKRKPAFWRGGCWC
jgi:hypothetical protein